MFKGIASFGILTCLVSFVFVQPCFSEKKFRIKSMSDTRCVLWIDKTPLDRNIVYCPLIQLLWQKLKKDVVKGDVMLYRYKSLGIRLNGSSVRERDFPADRTTSGIFYGYKEEDLLTSLNKTRKSLSLPAEEDLAAKDFPFGAYDVVGYGFLNDHPQFEYKLKKLSYPIAFQTGKKEIFVDGFGIEEYHSDAQFEIIKQVKVVEYNHPDDFIIKVEMSNDLELILAKIPSRESFQRTYYYVKKRIELVKSNYSSLLKGDQLHIPVIRINALQSFDMLTNNTVLNKEAEGWFFSHVFEEISFDLNSAGRLQGDQKMFPETQNPHLKREQFLSQRRFVFDKPFLFYVIKKGVLDPYLLAWVQNQRFLVTES